MAPTVQGGTLTDTSTRGIKTVLHPVSDLAKAKAVYVGASPKDPVRDVGGGRPVATVTDPDGNVLGLLQDP